MTKLIWYLLSINFFYPAALFANFAGHILHNPLDRQSWLIFHTRKKPYYSMSYVGDGHKNKDLKQIKN